MGVLGFVATASPSLADYSATVIGDGPAAYFRLNETGVLPTLDYATNVGSLGVAGNGHYVNGAVHPVPGAIVSQPANTAVNFPNAAVNRMRVPFNAALNVSGPFSFEFWAQPAATSSADSATMCAASFTQFGTPPGNTDGSRFGWLFYQNGAANWTFRSYGTGNASFNATGGSAPVVGAWHHIVGVWDGANTKLYVNGQQVASVAAATFAPVVDTIIPLTLGSRADGQLGAFRYNGAIDEAAYYNTALSPARILAHYDAGTNAAPATPYDQVVLTDSPVGFWRLSEPAFNLPVAANSGTLGASANAKYQYFSTTALDLDSPTYPGFAADNRVLQTSGTNGFVAAPALNLNANTVTMECWIKRNGAQGSYNGILFHRGDSGTATGIMFRDTSNELGYHWNDQYYNWVSSLIPPDGAWTYVALAVAPDKATMYMYDGTLWSKAENLVSHSPQAFAATTRIATDDGAGRFFNGLVDEAAIYPKTLTEGQLRTHALAGFGDPTSSKPVFVTDPPTLTPIGTIYTTTPFSLSADVYGMPPLTFQWRKDGANISGATSAVFARTSAALSDVGNYDVVVGNTFGSVTSSIVAVAIDPAVRACITAQPVTRLLYPGRTASFTVVAEGTAPIRYQWKHAGTNLPGATNATVFVANCTTAETGSYSCGVTNVAGGLQSSAASLSLTIPPPGSFQERVVANGPIAYWRLGETSGTTAFDYAGGNDGTYVNVAQGQPGFVLGDANGCAGFDGASAYVTTGRPLLNNRTQFTVMGWMKRGVTHSTRGGYFGQNDLLEFGDADSGANIEAWVNASAANIKTPWPWADDKWGFIALVGDGTAARLYVDGQVVGSLTSAVSSYGTNGFAFNIGGGGIFNNPAVNMDYFNGFIDEVALYDKALSADTIATLYSAGLFGATTPPFVTLNPVSQTAVVGNPVTFTGSANGTIPISYQWKKDGADIAGATSSALTISSVYFTDAGSYVLWATNAAGLTNTTAATLAVAAKPSFANQTNDLVLHLRFDGDYLDASGRANDAIAVGAPTFLAGKVGQGVHIATTPNNNYIIVTDPWGDFSFDQTVSFSVGFWIKYTAGFNDVPIIGNAVNSTWQLGWVFTDSATAGKIELSLTSVANTGTWLRDPVPGCPTINDGTWHHVLGVIDRTSNLASVYVDGTFAGSWSLAGLGTLATGNTLTIGQDPNGAYGTATFDMDDLGIWRRALTAVDAAGIYAAAQTGASFDVITPIKVDVKHVGGNVDVIWQTGTLKQATTVNGTYTTVPGAIAPFYRTSPTNSAMFFKVGN